MPRRRKDDATAWWHARASYVLALLWAPAVWVAIVSGVVHVVDRLGDAERDIAANRRDITRLDAEVRDLRARR